MLFNSLFFTQFIYTHLQYKIFYMRLLIKWIHLHDDVYTTHTFQTIKYL